jgi:hypothetical protein
MDFIAQRKTIVPATRKAEPASKFVPELGPRTPHRLRFKGASDGYTYYLLIEESIDLSDQRNQLLGVRFDGCLFTQVFPAFLVLHITASGTPSGVALNYDLM